MNRVLLVNLEKTPTREELVTSERVMGEYFLHDLDTEFAGYITAEGAFKLAAQWLVPTYELANVAARVKLLNTPGYQLRLYVDSKDAVGVQII